MAPSAYIQARSPREIAALRRPSWGELAESLRVMWVVLADSNETEELMIVEEILNRGPIAQLLAGDYFGGEEGQALLRDRPLITSKTVDLSFLRALRADTLGGAFVRHLDAHALDLDVFDAPTQILDAHPDIGFVVQRNRQTHDIWHTLLGLGVQGHEEVLVHAFTLGHLGMPQSFFISTLGALKHLVLEGRWQLARHTWRAAYRAGRAAGPLWAVYWERHWEEPLEAVRARLGVQPLELPEGASGA